MSAGDSRGTEKVQRLREPETDEATRALPRLSTRLAVGVGTGIDDVRGVDLGVRLRVLRVVVLLQRSDRRGVLEVVRPRLALQDRVREHPQHHQVEGPDDVLVNGVVRLVPGDVGHVLPDALQRAGDRVVGHGEVRGDREARPRLDLARAGTPKAPCGVWELFWTRLQVLERACHAGASGRRRREPHVLHRPDLGRDDHLVDEHVDAAAAVDRLLMQCVSGLVSLV